MIKEKMALDSDDSEIATCSLKVSLNCPVSKCRMTIPCRPVTCSHLQCFDAGMFLQMNERKAKWVCPVCDKSAHFDVLAIDGYDDDDEDDDEDDDDVCMYVCMCVCVDGDDECVRVRERALVSLLYPRLFKDQLNISL